MSTKNDATFTTKRSASGPILTRSARRRRKTAVCVQRMAGPDVKRWQRAIRKDGSLDQRYRLRRALTAPILSHYRLKGPQMFTETPDLIQALVQEGTGIHADVFKRVNAAYPYGVRLWDGDTGNTLELRLCKSLDDAIYSARGAMRPPQANPRFS